MFPLSWKRSMPEKRDRLSVTLIVSGLSLFTLQGAHTSLAAGTLQLLIDDITHDGTVAVWTISMESMSPRELGSKEGNIGLFLPAIEKSTFL